MEIRTERLFAVEAALPKTLSLLLQLGMTTVWLC